VAYVMEMDPLVVAVDLGRLLMLMVAIAKLHSCGLIHMVQGLVLTLAMIVAVMQYVVMVCVIVVKMKQHVRKTVVAVLLESVYQ
jgi:hypothetical protein